MRRWLFVLFFVVAMSVSVFAQSITPDPDSMNFDPVSWNQDVDPKTEWGRWLINDVKPYWDKIVFSIKSDAQRLNTDAQAHNEMPTFKVVEESHDEYCKDLGVIVPPPELDAFHSKFLEQCQYTIAEYLKDKGVQNKIDVINAEANTELKKVLEKHSVPQKVVDEFIRARQ